MQQPNKAVISPGLRGLMLVQQGLKELQGQGGAPAAGGLPTVLDQAKQAATQALGAQAPQQQAQPSMTPPPQGPQAPEGGIAGIAQNAATGANINDMKQKQAEQVMMQMAQQQQQQPMQMMASGGIAGLPAENMRGFAEGGVIGYDGTGKQGQFVASRDDKDAPLILRTELERELARVPADAADELRKRSNVTALTKELAGLGSPSRYAKAPSKFPDSAPANPPLDRPVRMPGKGGEGIPYPTPQGREFAETRPERVAGNTQPYTPPLAPVAQQDDLMKVIASVNKGFPAPTGGAARMAAYEKLLAERPLVGEGNIAAITKAQQQEEALNKQLEESALSRQLSAFLSGMQDRTEGATMGKFHAGEDTRKRAQIASVLNREQTIAAQRELQQAQRIGDSEKMMDAQNKLDTLETQRAGNAMGLTGTVYAANERLEAAKAAAKAALPLQVYEKIIKRVDDRMAQEEKNLGSSPDRATDPTYMDKKRLQFLAEAIQEAKAAGVDVRNMESVTSAAPKDNPYGPRPQGAVVRNK